MISLLFQGDSGCIALMLIGRLLQSTGSKTDSATLSSDLRHSLVLFKEALVTMRSESLLSAKE